LKLQKNGSHYEKTNVIFGLSAPKNIKKHQKIKMKKTRPKIRCPVNDSFSDEAAYLLPFFNLADWLLFIKTI